MSAIMFVVFLFWGIRILLNILAYTSLWFLKEYRWDRMLIHLKSPEGRRILMPPLRRPPITPKTVVLVSVGGILLTSLGIALPGPLAFKLFTVDILTFPVLSILVLLFRVPTMAYHAILIWLAIRKLRAHRPMTIIGITGSYGKTSTKEMLGIVLRDKYRVLTTEASKNSPIAIAETILGRLANDDEIFIVEMGAYKKGEIASMCSMVNPKIGIVTAINAQHQDLFGSMENTLRAKYELVQGLIPDGVAIMNLDNAYVRRMARWAKESGIRVIGYSTSRDSQGSEYLGISPAARRKALEFIVDSKGKKTKITVPLLGTHHVSNVLAVVAAARSCGMTMEEIVQACRHIMPVHRTMMPVPGINGAHFVDDTFNNNPDAAVAALKYLAALPGRRIIVFQPMIELGPFARESHELVAKTAAASVSEIILTNDSYREVFEPYKSKMGVRVLPPKAAAEHIRRTITKNDTVLFKGKQAAAVLQLLV